MKLTWKQRTVGIYVGDEYGGLEEEAEGRERNLGVRREMSEESHPLTITVSLETRRRTGDLKETSESFSRRRNIPLGDEF